MSVSLSFRQSASLFNILLVSLLFVNLTVCLSIYQWISHLFVFVFRSSSCQTGCACPRAPPPSIWLQFTFYISDDELSKSRTKVTGKYSSVKSKMACPKKSSETKEIAGRKFVRVKVRGQVISHTKWLTSLTRLHFIKLN